MIRALWALVKIAIVVAVVVWLAENPGSITIDWLDYKLTFHVGFFLLCMLVVVVLGIIIFSLIKYVLDLPKNMTRYRDMTHKEKGLKALTIGLAAVAAGDGKSAAYQAVRARKFLQDDEALPKLLEAQAARLQGKEMDSTRMFIELMDNKDAAFLGVRGLLQSALDCGDYKGALELGYRALEEQPKQGWILCIVYDLEIRARQWAAARKVLYRAEKAGAIAVNKANSDRVAMYLAEAEQAQQNGQEEVYFRCLNKAFKVDENFIPTVLRLAQMYLDRNKRKAAVSMIKKAWRYRPHPGLVALWDAACPPVRENDTMARVHWFEKLLALNPESVEGLQALAGVMIEQGLWGEARKYLDRAEGIRPNVYLYKMYARLEERATHDDMAVRSWLEKAADAPRERVWICAETGRMYEDWSPISDQGLFNTIIWDFPQGRNVSSMLLGANHQGSTPLIDAPRG
ncbi:MAG: heme biosynthesis protein HemY [Alphaproteobacteria bacterium]